MPTEVSFFSFSSLAYMHIRTATLRQTMCQTRFPFSSLAVLTAATPTIKGTVNPSVHKKTTRFSSKDVRVAHQTKYSEPFRSQENNKIFFTRSSSGPSDKLHWTLPSTRKQQDFLHKKFEWPIRQSTVNPSVHKKTTGVSSQEVRVAHQTTYSEPFRSLENNRGFFTIIRIASTPIRKGIISSNCNGNHANQTRYSAPLFS